MLLEVTSNMKYHHSQPTAFLPPAVTIRAISTRLAYTSSPLSITESIPTIPSSSTHLISSTAAAAAADVGSTQVFEAVAPDASLLVGFGTVVLLCTIAGYVWANDVVPVSRTKLAISKSRGEVRDYLDELKSIPDGGMSVDDVNATTTATISTATLDEGEITTSMGDSSESSQTVKPNAGDGRDFERWLFSDWLNKPGTKGGRQKEPALPILKEAKWNSGDNPVLVTAAIMIVGIVLASITERVAS